MQRRANQFVKVAIGAGSLSIQPTMANAIRREGENKIVSNSNAGPRLDRLPISRFHVRILCVIGAGMFLDIFELTLAAGVLGALVKEGWSDIQHNAVFISVTFSGMVLGAWFAGIVGDKYGRRSCYRLNLLLFAIPSFVAVVVPSMNWLIVARFFMGIGMGAEIVVGFTTLSEFVPPQQRGRWVGALSAIMNSAVFASALVGFLVIPSFGWRWIFAAVGVAAMVVWLLRQSLPESPRWLESRGRVSEAGQVLDAIELEVGKGTTLPAPLVTRAVQPKAVSVGILFSRKLIRRTIVGASLLVALNIAAFGFIAWLPTFFVTQGYTVASALGFTTLMSLGGPIGGLIGLWCSDRIGRKSGILIFCVLGIILAIAYPFMTDVRLIVAIGFALVTTVYVLSCLAIAIYVPELFPTEVRMRGAGFCNMAGRLAVIGAQPLVVPLYQYAGVTGVVLMLALVLACATLIVAVFGEETNSLSLEELDPTTA
jgi:MFS transporter, putative metabolite:H+ symporter